MSRSVSVDCPSCGEAIRVKAEVLGRRGRCPHCREVVTLPAAPEPDFESEFEDYEEYDDEPAAAPAVPRRQAASSTAASAAGSRPLIIVGAVAGLVLLVACAVVVTTIAGRRAVPVGPAADNPLAAQGVSSEAPPPDAPAGSAPLTDDECLAFAKEIENDLATQNAAALHARINWDDMIERATADTGAPEVTRRQFQAGVKSTLAAQGLAAQLVQQTALGGRYDFLRIVDDASGKRLLFRLMLPGGGVNYHELYLGRRSGSSLEIVDIYVFMSGELLSTTMRRGFLPVAASATRSVFERLSGAEQDLITHAATITAMVQAQHQGRFHEVLASYATLSPALQRNKNILLVTLRAAQQTGGLQQYEELLERFRDAYPTDACVDFLSIDFYVLREQYPESLACIDKVDKSVGGDPSLGIIRAGVHATAGDLPNAIAAVQKTVADEPTLPEGYVALANLYLASREFGKYLELSDQYAVQFEQPLMLDPGDANVQALTASPEYKAHQARKNAAP